MQEYGLSEINIEPRIEKTTIEKRIFHSRLSEMVIGFFIDYSNKIHK